MARMVWLNVIVFIKGMISTYRFDSIEGNLSRNRNKISFFWSTVDQSISYYSIKSNWGELKLFIKLSIFSVFLLNSYNNLLGDCKRKFK